MDEVDTLLKRWVISTFVVSSFAAWSAFGQPVASTEGPSRAGQLLTAMTCQPLGARRVSLKMVILNAGREFAHDRAARVEFVTAPSDRRMLQSPPPGPRTTTVPLRSKGWAPDHVEVVSFGPFVFDGQMPKQLHVRAGLDGESLAILGTLVRDGDGEGDTRITFRRVLPWPSVAKGERRVLAAAAAQRVDGRRFVLRAAYFNGGEEFATDYSAFIHFELNAEGENLDQTIALKLHPMSQRMDTSAWDDGELTVVTFGPIDIPRNVPKHVYVRAGMYDQFGSGERLMLPGSDDGTGRVLVGRFVTKDGATVFQRIGLGR